MADPDIALAPGVLLIAPPMMRDPNFWRSVVLLCEHGPDGSFGLILNRPIALKLGEVMNDLQGEDMISLGGPIQQNMLHFLHRHGDLVSEAIPIIDSVYWAFQQSFNNGPDPGHSLLAFTTSFLHGKGHNLG